MVPRSEGRKGETLPSTSVTSTREGDLTVLSVHGDATPSVLIDAFRQFLADPTHLLLWDMRGCQLGLLDHDQLRWLVNKVVRSNHSKRPPGKSAFVCRSEEDRNVARLMIAYGAAVGFGEEAAVFGNITQARHWLTEDRP